MKIGDCLIILRDSLSKIRELRSVLRKDEHAIHNLLALLHDSGKEKGEVEEVLSNIEAKVQDMQDVNEALQKNFEETDQGIREALDFSSVSDIYQVFKILRTKLIKAGTPTAESLEFAEIVDLLQLQHRYLSHRETCEKLYLSNEIKNLTAKAKGITGKLHFRMVLNEISSRAVLNYDLEGCSEKLKEMEEAIKESEYLDPAVQKKLFNEVGDVSYLVQEKIRLANILIGIEERYLDAENEMSPEVKKEKMDQLRLDIGQINGFCPIDLQRKLGNLDNP